MIICDAFWWAAADPDVDVIALVDKKTNVESWPLRKTSCPGHIWPLLVVGDADAWWRVRRQTGIVGPWGAHPADTFAIDTTNTRNITRKRRTSPVHCKHYIQPIHLLYQYITRKRNQIISGQCIFYTTVHLPGMGTPASLFERVICAINWLFDMCSTFQDIASCMNVTDLKFSIPSQVIFEQLAIMVQ